CGSGDGAWSIAGEGDGLASWRPARPRSVLEGVGAHVVERLNHVGLGQERLDDLARRRPWIGEVLAVAVDLPPVVGRVHDELAAQRGDRQAAGPAAGDGEDSVTSAR